MKDTYLTIDLDFWNNRDLDINWLNKISTLQVPKYAVEHHHHIIPHVNSVNTTRMVNVDFHADVCDDEPDMTLECGTWGNYISWASKGKFIWIYPHEDCANTDYRIRSEDGRFRALYGAGTCHSKHSPFSKRIQYNKWPLGQCKRREEPIPNIDLKRVAYVSFCTSPDFRDSELQEPWDNFIDNNNIPWIKTEKESIIPKINQWNNI
jgi:hypothetical protein